jgi:ABC-type multidrug transport system ATPase subunit
MSTLSGLTPPTAGDALFYGKSVTKNMDEIRSMLGICPQHDILFNELTPVEHIELYGGLKNLGKDEIQALCKERLTAVRLWKVKDQPSGQFSGGYALII